MCQKNLVPGKKRPGMVRIFFGHRLHRFSKFIGVTYLFPGLVRVFVMYYGDISQIMSFITI